MRTLLLAVSPLALAAAAIAQPNTETFENGVNAGGWRLFPGSGGTVLPTGGYPDGYLRGTAPRIPELRTTGSSVFTGDWTQRGWEFVDYGPNAPAEKQWQTLMHGVSQVRFLWTTPGTAPGRGEWAVSIDNIGIGTAGQVGQYYPNCTGNTNVPFLTVHDFVCFQGSFAAGNAYANCDGSTTPPVLNISDFICFQARFAAGCSAP